jgi:hypothetical protein
MWESASIAWETLGNWSLPSQGEVILSVRHPLWDASGRISTLVPEGKALGYARAQRQRLGLAEPDAASDDASVCLRQVGLLNNPLVRRRRHVRASHHRPSVSPPSSKASAASNCPTAGKSETDLSCPNMAELYR